MSHSSGRSEHPLLAAAHAVGTALDEVAGVDPLYLSIPEKQALLVELTRLSARLTGLRAEVLAVADDVAVETGARSAGTWLAMETRTTRREAAHHEQLGVALRDRWPTVGEAVAAGRVTWDQADVLVRALDMLPESLGAELRAKAEAHLVTEAGHFDPASLRRLGRHVLEVVAPDLADQHEARALAAEEHRAQAATRLSFRPRGDGTTDLYARLPDPVASRLRAYLDAYTSPRRIRATQSDVDHLPLTRRRGEAFCALLEHIPADGLPSHGGTATTVMVTIDLDTLRDELTGLGLAETTTGDTLTAAQTRRLACTAGIIPVVLGGQAEILDLGRTRRLFTPAQRKALALRDRRCRAEGCDISAAWCEAPHTNPWTRGGKTDLANGQLLCSFHHHRAHDTRYTTHRLPNGDIRYRRRT